MTPAEGVARVTLYTRAGCHLCEEAERVLTAERAATAFHLELVDVDRDPVLPCGLVDRPDGSTRLLELLDHGCVIGTLGLAQAAGERLSGADELRERDTVELVEVRRLKRHEALRPVGRDGASANPRDGSACLVGGSRPVVLAWAARPQRQAGRPSQAAFARTGSP